MDSSRFDTLVKVLATRHPRRAALSLLSAIAGVGLAREGTGAAKNTGAKRVRVCNCASANVATCTSQKKPKDKAKKLLRTNPCAYKGRCTGVSGCAAGTILPPPGGPPPPPPCPTCPATTPICNGGICKCDAASASCVTGCCDGTSCQVGTSNTACGTNGAACEVCPSPNRPNCGLLPGGGGECVV